jgi:chemotaxis protein MotB
MAAAKDNVRPIIIRRVKKAAHSHHGGAWKVAYADFVTAMMAFFMLLWLISNPDKERLKGLAQYFSPAAPNSPSSATGDSLSDMPGAGGRTRKGQSDSKTSVGQPSAEAGVAGAARGGTANVPDASLRVLAQELRVSIDSIPEAADARENMKVESTRDGLRISLMDSAKRPMFQGTTARLNGYAHEMLVRVATKLRRSGAQISIEGHTDATGGQSEANWRLSSERALSARSAMIAGGLTPDRFSEVVGKAATQPVYPDQPERPENRRITVVVLGEASALPSDSSFKF